MISGQPNVDNPNRYPANSGLTAAARLRGTAAVLAAAGRSSGVTTAITYDVRVGTSICESNPRANNSAMATGRFGANGSAIKQKFAGKCVKTIVLIKPNRLDSRTAIKNDTAAQRPAQNKI